MLSHRAHFSSTLTKGMLPPSAATSSITWERQVSSSPPAASPERVKIAFISTGGLPEAATGEDLRELIRLRSAVAERAGGDPSFKSVHQPVRVAGSIHGKNGAQRLVRIVEDFAIEYELSDLTERVNALPLEPAFAPLSSATKRPLSTTGIDGLMTSQTRAGGIDGETRFSALSRVIGHWIRQVRQRRATLEQAREAVSDYNAAMIVPPWPQARLNNEFDALLRVDLCRNGALPSPDGLPDVPPPR